MIKQKVQIYALIDPRNNQIRYVGKTINTLQNRLREHIWISRTERSKCRRAVWIKELFESNLKPEIVLLETVNENQWRKAEQKWEKDLKNQGFDLLNDLPTGGGCGRNEKRIKWNNELLNELGKVPDSVIAEKLNVSRKAITYKRNTLSIKASFDRTRNTPPPKMAGWNKISLPQDAIEKLGKLPDYILAKEYSVSKKTIQRARNERNIKPYASISGNNGQFQKGQPHPRWQRQNTQSNYAPSRESKKTSFPQPPI